MFEANIGFYCISFNTDYRTTTTTTTTCDFAVRYLKFIVTTTVIVAATASHTIVPSTTTVTATVTVLIATSHERPLNAAAFSHLPPTSLTLRPSVISL